MQEQEIEKMQEKIAKLERNNEWLRETIEKYQNAIDKLNDWIDGELETLYNEPNNGDNDYYDALAYLSMIIYEHNPRIHIDHSKKYKKEHGIK